jgi:hypothetical protein
MSREDERRARRRPETRHIDLRGGSWQPGPGGVLRWVPAKPKSDGRYNRKPITLSPEEIRRGYSAYRQGSRTEFAVTANREYQRIWRRNRKQAA